MYFLKIIILSEYTKYIYYIIILYVHVFEINFIESFNTLNEFTFSHSKRKLNIYIALQTGN